MQNTQNILQIHPLIPEETLISQTLAGNNAVTEGKGATGYTYTAAATTGDPGTLTLTGGDQDGKTLTELLGGTAN